MKTSETYLVSEINVTYKSFKTYLLFNVSTSLSDCLHLILSLPHAYKGLVSLVVFVLLGKTTLTTSNQNTLCVYMYLPAMHVE